MLVDASKSNAGSNLVVMIDRLMGWCVCLLFMGMSLCSRLLMSLQRAPRGPLNQEVAGIQFFSRESSYGRVLHIVSPVLVNIATVVLEKYVKYLEKKNVW